MASVSRIDEHGIQLLGGRLRLPNWRTTKNRKTMLYSKVNGENDAQISLRAIFSSGQSFNIERRFQQWHSNVANRWEVGDCATLGYPLIFQIACRHTA